MVLTPRKSRRWGLVNQVSNFYKTNPIVCFHVKCMMISSTISHLYPFFLDLLFYLRCWEVMGDSYPLAFSNPTFSCLLTPKCNYIYVYDFHFTSSDTERCFCKFLLLDPPFILLRSTTILLWVNIPCIVLEIKLHLHRLCLHQVSGVLFPRFIIIKYRGTFVLISACHNLCCPIRQLFTPT